MRTEGVRECWKCFHKNGPLGRPFNFNAKEIQVFLNRKIIPTAMHALWAIDTMGLEKSSPIFDTRTSGIQFFLVG